nr:hypothetical protein [Geobacillus zalihae]
MNRGILVSGIRPTGELHLGNYYGAMKNILELQEKYNSYFFISDIHSLTTHPKPDDLTRNVLKLLKIIWQQGSIQINLHFMSNPRLQRKYVNCILI